MSKQEITSAYPTLFLSPHFYDQPCKIKIIDASSSKKSLGHQFLFNDDIHNQIARIHEIIDEYILLTSTTKLSKNDEIYAYNMYLLGRLCHLLATTCIKQADWHLIKKNLSKNVLFSFLK